MLYKKVFLSVIILKPPKSSQITKRLQKMCSALFREKRFFVRKIRRNLWVVFLWKIVPWVVHIPDDPEMKKKNIVSFNKNLKLRFFVKKNPTISECVKESVTIFVPLIFLENGKIENDPKILKLENRWFSFFFIIISNVFLIKIQYFQFWL